MKTLTFVIACIFLTGCAGVDIVIREDTAPSPLFKNYLTMAFETICEGEKVVSFGQSGCSVDFDSDLSKSSISIIAPLRMSLTVRSKGTGYDRRFLLNAGEKRTFQLNEIIPRLTEHAVYDFVTKWEKPDSVKTEVALLGQHGRFYFRLRPKESEAANLIWQPEGSATIKTLPGMSFSQFRATGPVDEPIMLEVHTSQSVGIGRYQLYSETEQIGIKNTEFSGDEILVPQSAIVGKGKTSSYTLAGWATSQELSLQKLDNDFIVGINLFDKSVEKLSASIEFTETEVCFKTENTVSLVAYSASDKPSNEIEGCFKKPAEESYMIFLTNVGRSALAHILPNDSYVLHQ